MADYSIETITAENVGEFGFFCIRNKKHPGYVAKRAWLQQRFKEGLRIKLLLTKEGTQAGFLEYIPGEYTWRVVDAPGYFVIHCIWVNSVKFLYKGMGSALVESCINDAEESGKKGVAVVTSDGPWMAKKGLFVNNGFTQVDEAKPYYQLLVKSVVEGSLPSFPDNWEERLKKTQHLQLLYTNQCPYIGKAMAELPPVARRYDVELKLIEMKSPKEARERMPSPYGVFNLVYQGKLLADHPINATRFRNILEKNLKLKKKLI